MVPPKVRLGLSGRPLEVDDILRSLRLPVLVTHGAEDKNSNLIAAEYTAKIIPGAKLSIYQGVGHSPFLSSRPKRNTKQCSLAIIWQPAPAARSCETEIAIACTIGIDTGKNTLHMIGLDEKGIQARSPSRRAGTHQLVDLERTNGPSPEKPCHHRSSRPTS